MLLVPKQLRRSGMTGDVPYYGGRFTPAQAYAASHPSHPHPQPAAAPAAAPEADPLPALQQLLDTGVITAEEYQDLRARVNR
ncbi:SHOCT domain-containing protein [Actinoplanes sp. NPDC023936]|uniref:SHOCT domain-containing protein n=1 Tax=Actinoplanes sp. NPDC023936 TaxID=3154910 RepID=UPI0034118CA4